MEAEVRINQWLSLNSINCTPLFYGIYENIELGIPAIVLEYVGEGVAGGAGEHHAE